MADRDEQVQPAAPLLGTLTQIGPGTCNRYEAYSRLPSRADDELHRFRSWIQWLCVGQTGAVLSLTVFLCLGIAVPFTSHYLLTVASDLPGRRRHASYDAVVQLSLTSVAGVSFACLSIFLHRYGLRRFLFLDKLYDESEAVRHGYTDQLNWSFKLLCIFVLPCFLAEFGYKVWWYLSGGRRHPFLGNPYVSDAVACFLELSSWLYRTAIFFVVCVLFHLACYLQILRLKDFILVFQNESDVTPILKEHFRICRQLHITSRRFRFFIVISLILVSLSQLASLLLTTRSNAEVNLFNAGELALCSLSLVAGLLICLRSATKITHKGQAITSLASKWHACATNDSFDADPGITAECSSSNIYPLVDDDGSDYETVDEDDWEDTRPMRLHVNSISFQQRLAFVTYLENNRAGITVYGAMLDRSWLTTIFGVELSLVLWLLGKTVGIS